MIALLLAPAFARDVYINGVRADVPPVMTMTGCEVRFDESGNVWVTAPGYRVHVESAAPPEPVSTASPAPVSGALPAGTWWLVTEDNDSTGHTLEIVVNGTLVRRVRSGDVQAIVDVSGWLRRGENQVSITALPGTYGGGLLTLYLGRGDDQTGTIRMDNPAVRHQRRSTDSPAGATRQYTVVVP